MPATKRAAGEDDRRTERIKRRFCGTHAIVTIKAGKGDDITEVKAFQEVLKDRSDFWKKALDKNWQSNAEPFIELPVDEPDVVNFYLTWIVDKQDGVYYYPSTEPDTHFGFLVKLYLFGQKVCDPRFQDGVLQILVGRVNESGSSYKKKPLITTMDTLFDETLPRTPMREFFRDYYLHEAEPKWFEEELHQDLVREILRDMVVYQRAGRSDRSCKWLAKYRWAKDVARYPIELPRERVSEAKRTIVAPDPKPKNHEPERTR